MVDHPVEQLEEPDAGDHRGGPAGPGHVAAAPHVGQQEQAPHSDEPGEGVEEPVGGERHLGGGQVVEVVPLQAQMEDEQVDHGGGDAAAEQEAGGHGATLPGPPSAGRGDGASA